MNQAVLGSSGAVVKIDMKIAAPVSELLQQPATLHTEDLPRAARAIQTTKAWNHPESVGHRPASSLSQYTVRAELTRNEVGVRHGSRGPGEVFQMEFCWCEVIMLLKRAIITYYSIPFFARLLPAVVTVGRALPEVSLDEVVRRPPRPALVIPELGAEAMSKFFAGVYERDAHIRLIYDALRSYADSLQAWKNDNSVELARSHVLLWGKTAGAKTMLLERFKAFLEQENRVERVTFVDMQTSTKAGLENWLLDKAEQGELAEIIVLEEIEKVQPLDALLPLVSIMGSGYLAKMNARIGNRGETTNVLVIATCNNEEVIREWRSGVLWSRFVHHLFCPRPGREVMRKILLDKVHKLGGNPGWVDKTLEFAFDILPEAGVPPMDDPRELKGLLDGRDRLLDGQYQQDLLDIMRAESVEREGGVAGFGCTAVNREVERAAIKFVTARYQQEGWQVVSVESERVGYDLLATKDGDERHLEVKGTGGADVDFILTAGEKRR